MTDFQLSTPVAFITFNRPNTTARVFEAIREAEPSQPCVSHLIAHAARLYRNASSPLLNVAQSARPLASMIARSR